MLALSALVLANLFCCAPQVVRSAETWETLDRKLKTQIYQLNVGIKMRIKGGYYAHLADLSPKLKLPVYSTTMDDKGFRVIGFGSSFPIRTVRTDKTFFLTNRHVVESGTNITIEAQRFFAAMFLHAQNNAGFGDPDTKLKELLATVNLSQKGKSMNPIERFSYQSTVDGIWDTYENHLSMRADPTRERYKKYVAMSGFEAETGYFLHAPGPVSQESIPATIYKTARGDNQPDLAVLAVSLPNLPKMDFDTVGATEGQEIQVIGYPLVSDQIDLDSSKYYAPTFSTGRVSRVSPTLLQVDAPVHKGNSGGPVVSLRGKVIGVVVRRAMSAQNIGGAVVESELPNFAGAITIQAVKNFASELFAKQIAAPARRAAKN